MTSNELETVARIGKLKREAPTEEEILDIDERLVEDVIDAAQAVRKALRAAGG